MATVQTRTSNVALLASAGLALATCNSPSFDRRPPEVATDESLTQQQLASAYQRYQERDRTPYQEAGIYRGRLYGAFETHWFQDFKEDQIWTFYGPDSGRFWELWETDQVVPPAYERWQAEGTESESNSDGEFYPYLCVEASFRGRWSGGCRDCAPDDDSIAIDEMLSMTIVDLPAEECIPAFGALMRDEWWPTDRSTPHNKRMPTDEPRMSP